MCGSPRVIADLEAVVDQVDERQRHGEQAGVDVLQRESVVADERDHFGGVRPERPDDGVVAVFVGAQDAVRVVVCRRRPGGPGRPDRAPSGSWRVGRLAHASSRSFTSCAAASIRDSDGMSGMLMMWATACPGSMRT